MKTEIQEAAECQAADTQQMQPSSVALSALPPSFHGLVSFCFCFCPACSGCRCLILIHLPALPLKYHKCLFITEASLIFPALRESRKENDGTGCVTSDGRHAGHASDRDLYLH